MKSPKPILVVDDDAGVREFVCVALSEEGYAVTAVANGLAALEAARSNPPGLILLDLWMPGMDGLGFLHAYRQAAPAPRTPVIIFAAAADSGARAAQAHVDAFLPKPFDLDDLLDEVARRLDGG